MQPTDKKALEALIKEAKAAGKNTSELEKMLAENKFVKPTMGETKEEEVEREVLTMTEKGAKKAKTKGKRVIVSTGPAREDDFT